MFMKALVRPVKQDEIRELAVTFIAAFPLNVRAQLGSEAVRAYLGSFATHDAYCFLVAICDTEIAGFAVLQIDQRRSIGWRWVFPYWRRLLGYLVAHPGIAANSLNCDLARLNTSHLVWVAVNEEFRGHGIGEQLVRECIDRSRSAGRSLLELAVEANNFAAINLYEKIGFQRNSYADRIYDSRRNKMAFTL